MSPIKKITLLQIFSKEDNINDDKYHLYGNFLLRIKKGVF